MLDSVLHVEILVEDTDGQTFNHQDKTKDSICGRRRLSQLMQRFVFDFSFLRLCIPHSRSAACSFISVGWRYGEVVDSAHPQTSYQSGKC